MHGVGEQSDRPRRRDDRELSHSREAQHDQTDLDGLDACGAVAQSVVGAVSVIAAFPKEQAADLAAANAPAEFPPLTPQQKVELEKWFDLQPKVEIPISPEGAKVLMVKFNDYQCPPCRQTYEAYGPLLEKWTKTGQFKFVLKHFPLNSICNGGSGSVHPAACDAAVAVVLARRGSETPPRGTAARPQRADRALSDAKSAD